MSKGEPESAWSLADRTPRSEEETVCCRWMRAKVLISVGMHHVIQEVPEDPHIIAGRMHRAVITVPIVQGAPLLTLICFSPAVLELTRATLVESLRSSIGIVMTRMEMCRLCPFWEEVIGKEAEP